MQSHSHPSAKKALFPRLWPFAAFALLLFYLALFAPAFSGKNATLPDQARPGFEAIRARDMHAILSFLASDELEGRETTERGLKIAAKFLASQYALAGLSPAPGQTSMEQKFFVIKNRLDPKTRITLLRGKKQVEPQFTLYKDFYTTSRKYDSTNMEAPVVFAGYGIEVENLPYDDYKNLEVKGKIVMVLPGLPKSESLLQALSDLGSTRQYGSRRYKADVAREKGAVAVLFITSRPLATLMARFQKWLARPSFSLMEDQAPFPQFVISQTMADAILRPSKTSFAALQRKIEKTGRPASFLVKKTRLRIHLQVQSEMKETQNIIAYLPGADPQLRNQFVALTAHYDHLGKRPDGTIYNGADDDGSGTTAILEIARAFAKNPNRPARSLLFISHTGEEKGLLGSKYYTNHPVVPLKNMTAVLNIDMIGRNEENRVFIIGSNFLSLELHQINEQANQLIGLNLDYKYNSTTDPNRFYYRSDHYNYARHDIPIIFYFTGTHEDYHQPTDTVDKINFNKMQKIARLVYLTAWHVANLDHALPLNGLLKSHQP